MELPRFKVLPSEKNFCFKDENPKSPRKSFHLISWGSALFSCFVFLPPLFNESWSHTPNRPLGARVGVPLPRADWGSVFLRREASRRPLRPTGAEPPVAGPPGLTFWAGAACSRPWGSRHGPLTVGSGSVGTGWPCEFHRDCPRCALGLLLVSCLFSFPRGNVPWAGSGPSWRGPRGQARRITTLSPWGRALAALLFLLDLPPSSSGI